MRSAIVTERWRPPVQPIAIVRCVLPSATYAGQQEVEQGQEPLVELVRQLARLDVLDDLRVAAGERPQVLAVVGVRQEADVEHQVGVARRPVLEPEGEDRQRQLRRARAAPASRSRSGGAASRR